MISPIKVNGQICFLTRTGTADTGTNTVVTEIYTFWLALNRYLHTTNHASFADHLISQNKTPIFEYISKSQGSNVIKYPENLLILLGIRDNVTGEQLCPIVLFKACSTGCYSSCIELKEEAAQFEIPGL
jgi:hypothetical protein